MFKGRFAWIAEALGGILLFLLPIKFGTLVSLPSITMIYWSDPISLFIASWPFPFFPLFSGIFLLISLLLVPGEIFPGKSGFWTGLWGILALCSLLGGIAGGCPADAFPYFVNHTFSIGTFLIGFARIVNHNRKIIGVYHGIFSSAFLLTLLIGLNQYFSGYQETINQIYAQDKEEINGSILFRLEQMRVTGGFSACNAYAGYLVLSLPIALAWLWKMGSRVSPPKVSRILFTVPVFLAGVFLLVKTGSRGGVLSLLAAVFMLLYASKMTLKWRCALFSLIPLGIAGITALVMLGRGGKSILFRLDYFQGAFRMMLDSPLYGAGWGGFQREFMKLKMIYDAEAPASPHNFPLSMGSQTGVAGFLIACLILFLGGYYLYRYLAKEPLKENLKDDRIFPASAIAGITAFTVHSLQDILFETPGAIISYGAIVIMTLVLITPEPEQGTLESAGWQKKLKPVLLCTVLLYCGASLFFAWKVLSFDYALATLNDMVDIRLLSKEEFARINMNEVGKAFENAVRKNPDSPYPYLTMSDFYSSRGDVYGALDMSLKALEKEPESAALNMRVFRIMRHMGKKEEAMPYLNRACELAPMNPVYQKERTK